ncbi:MAG: ATP-binding cassette domain-containing protein [Myxococcales bacterium]|nr:ATP-binding cassette domain-containing protein [Myxococcales bacterium]
MSEILAHDLVRSFPIRERTGGIGGAIADLFRPSPGQRRAVDGVSFRIGAGETVALIGPNGAGKSTTVKLLTGILTPTTGTVRVGGLDPWADRTTHVRRIGAVFGQRTQLWWDLSVVEAYELLAKMYHVSSVDYRRRLEHFDAVLGVGPLLRTPVRQLSLGERMRCELAAALLHAPPLLLLDEPTVGLDVAVKLRLRAFLTALRDEGTTTVLLTTHDLGEVRALCPRVLLLGRGRLLHDGPLDSLLAGLGGRRAVRVFLRDPVTDAQLARLPDAERIGPAELLVVVDGPVGVADRVRSLVNALDVVDLRIEEPAVDTLVAQFYEAPR